jgi:hypothetical protein
VREALVNLTYEGFFIPQKIVAIHASKSVSMNFCPTSRRILFVSFWLIISRNKGCLSKSMVIVPLFTDSRKFEIIAVSGSKAACWYLLVFAYINEEKDKRKDKNGEV